MQEHCQNIKALRALKALGALGQVDHKYDPAYIALWIRRGAPFARAGGGRIAPEPMAYAEFSDREGRCWRVWHTRPRLAEVLSRLPSEWKDGWLTFECDGDKRRLAPVPRGWEDFSAPRLDLLRRMAEPAAAGPTMSDPLRREERASD